MKTLKQIQEECVFVNAGNKCLNCGGCREEYEKQFPKTRYDAERECIEIILPPDHPLRNYESWAKERLGEYEYTDDGFLVPKKK